MHYIEVQNITLTDTNAKRGDELLHEAERVLSDVGLVYIIPILKGYAVAFRKPQLHLT